MAPSHEGRDDEGQPPELADLSRELRGRVGPEFRAEAEESERQAAAAARRRRTLADVAGQLRSRGDRVAVALPGRVLTGVVVYVGEDFLALATPGGQADVPLTQPLTLRVVDPARGGGVGVRTGPPTLRARLLELELDGGQVELAAFPLGDVHRGRLTTVGRDHVVVTDTQGDQWYVAMGAIGYVVRRDG